MDLLRSCYSTEFRFYTDDPRTVTVDWYFVDDETPFIPYWTPFGSANWRMTDQQWDDELGEVCGAPRTWRDGSKVGDAAGTNTCGTADQWRNGQPSPPAEPVDLDEFGTPECCDKVDKPVKGRICVNCPGDAWNAYDVITFGVSDRTCACAGANGTFRLVYFGGCVWQGEAEIVCGVPRSVPIRLTRFNSGITELFFDTGGGSVATYLDTDNWDCLSELIITKHTQSGHNCLWPFTVIIRPPGP